jgi:hypothetical protein
MFFWSVRPHVLEHFLTILLFYEILYIRELYQHLKSVIIVWACLGCNTLKRLFLKTVLCVLKQAYLIYGTEVKNFVFNENERNKVTWTFRLN